LNVVRIYVVLLHTLVDWLKNKNYPHYFVNNCNLIDSDSTVHVEIIASRLMSITESWLSSWFVNNYLRKCAQLCPDRVSRLFDDISTSTKLQNAVSAVVDWRLNSALQELQNLYYLVKYYISSVLHSYSLSVQSCDYWVSNLSKMDFRLCAYFYAIAFLHVVYETTRNGLNDKLIDVLATVLGKFVSRRRYCNKLNSIMSLSQAANLMKVVVNNSRSTVQLIEIELSKAYLYRAVRCTDSDSDSIYCLANVYLAVLYYTTGQYQTAIDHCTLVTRSEDHSQCSSHVVQGELLPKIDDNIDNVLGIAVFYQYVRTAALNQQQQIQHVSVFTSELFARYLYIRCLSVILRRQFAEKSSTDEVQLYIKSIFDSEQPLLADMLLVKLIKMPLRKEESHSKPPTECRQKLAIVSTELDTLVLVELLQQSAVEHLTIFRQLEALDYDSSTTFVTTDYEAMYAYKRGDYRYCLQLSTQNVRNLFYAVYMRYVLIYPEFIQLLDDDIVSLNAMRLLLNSDCRDMLHDNSTIITQLTLSLYLTTQCQLKLHHSVKSLAQTFYYIKVTRQLILRLIN